MAGKEDQVKLLNAFGSPFGARAVMALEEKAVQYEHILEDFHKGKSQLLLQMNPIYKQVPVLIHNGKPICESLIIVQYIEETWSHKPLLPSHPYARAHARFWADFADKKFFDSMSRIVGTKGEAQEEAKRDTLGCLDLLEVTLGEGPYFGGEEFGFLDIALVTFTAWFHAVEIIGNFKIPLDTKYPGLKAWIEKCMERESVKKALPPPDKILAFAKELRKKFLAGK